MLPEEKIAVIDFQIKMSERNPLIRFVLLDHSLICYLGATSQRVFFDKVEEEGIVGKVWEKLHDLG